MRRLSLCLAVAAGMLSGCANIAVSELRYSGGYPGAVLDQRFFNASHSKQLQLLRSAMIISMASRIGTAYVRDGKEAEAFVDYLRAATDELNYMAGHLYPVPGKTLCTDLSQKDCDAHSVMFESEIPQLEARMVKLVVAALPQDRAAAFLNAIKRGDVLSAAWKALRFAASAADGAHRGAAVHRSELELRALLVQGSKEAGVACKNGDTNPISTVNQAAYCMNQPLNKLRAADDAMLPQAVPAQAFETVFGIMRTSCGLLPLDTTLEAGGTDTRATDRKADCAKIKFKPDLRFGGLRGFGG